MLGLAWQTIKGRKGGFVGAFIALFCASALVTACGILLESGLTSGVPPERYAGVPLVVGANQSLERENVPSTPYGGQVRLPADTVDKIAAVPGVKVVRGDISFPLTVVKNDSIVALAPHSLLGHSWDSALLAPFKLASGEVPKNANSVVLDSQLAAKTKLMTGDRFIIAVGAIPKEYTVSGIAALENDKTLRQHSIFFTSQEATRLAGHPGQIDAAGVVPAEGVNIDELAQRVKEALGNQNVQTFTGDARGSIEFLDVAQAKSTLVAVSGSFGGVALMVALFIVISTLALQIQQRRREFALLRAIAATPRQLHRLVGIETVIVSLAAGLLGVVPGVFLSYGLRDAFAAIGLVPADFQLAIGFIPMLVAVVMCVAAARLAGWVSARKMARIRPVEALGEAAIQTPKLGLVRSIIGIFLFAVGIVLALLPLWVAGDSATGAAAISVIVLVIATALLGPRIAAVSIALLGPIIRRCFGTSGYLAAANTNANSRRLAAAIIPLVLAIAISSVQLFTSTTRVAFAQKQASAGVVADFVVTGSVSGLNPQIAEAIKDTKGVAVATPVARTQLLGNYTVPGASNTSTRSFAGQGVSPESLASTMNLDVRTGNIDDLHGNTVALSQSGAGIFGAGLGDKIQLYLSDGTPITPSVVAIYGNGLGFGDVTLPRDTLLKHSPNGMDDMVLVKAGQDVEQGTVAAALQTVADKYTGVDVKDRASFTAAQQGQLEMQGFATMLLLAAVFGYIAIGVANTLVMATIERRREFALLRLTGMNKRQVRGMMRVEAGVVMVIAAVVGSLLALPPLIGVSLGLSEQQQWIPSISWLLYGVILLVISLIAVLSIMIPTRLVMRTRPVETIGLRE